MVKSCANIGQYTLGIYVVQSLILEKMMSRVFDFSNLSRCFFDGVLSPFITMTFIIVCVFCIKRVRNHMIRSILFGIN